MGNKTPTKIGKTYGDLYIKDYDYESHMYICQCKCGNIFKTKSSNLRDNDSRRGISMCPSCRAKKEKAPQCKKIGKRFGKLVVTEFLGNKLYKCKCDCGKECYVKTSELRKDKRRCKLSCGCDVISYNKNEDFFSVIDTEEKAYIAGFIAADGNVNENCGNIKITLNSGDYEILEKISNCIEYNGPIRIKKVTTTLPQGTLCNSETAELVICSRKLVNDLISYGITARKSLTLNFDLANLREDLVRHFLRGYVDGDGSCNITRGSKKTSYKICFVSSSIMINNINEELIKRFPNLKTYIVKSKNNDKTSFLYINGKKYFQQIVDFLYKDSTIYLERKYNLYLKNLKILKLLESGVLPKDINYTTGEKLDS